MTSRAGSPRFVLSSIDPQGSVRRSSVTGYTLTPTADVNWACT